MMAVLVEEKGNELKKTESSPRMDGRTLRLGGILGGRGGGGGGEALKGRFLAFALFN
jgi:hypothetical protein